jgi:pimeloyl-ACP methyl ester carboxylesterase
MAAIEVRKYAGAVGPVVLLHGGPGAPGAVAGLATGLAGDFEVWEPLQRRSGEVELTVDRHVDDLHDVAPHPVLIVGHSWGAMLGLSYAARYPELVRALTLVGCGTYTQASRDEYERRINATRDASGSEPKRVPEDPAGHEETWRDVLRRQAAGIEPQSFTAIRAPVLMLHGKDDPHPGEMIRDSLLPHIPHLEYVGIARCGHEPWQEGVGRRQFDAALRAWLRER